MNARRPIGPCSVDRDRRVRRLGLRAAVGAVVVLVATGGHAPAAGAGRVCALVPDRDNDVRAISGLVPLSAVGEYFRSLDIKQFDVATGRKTFVAELRVATTKVDTTSPNGVTYTVEFDIEKSHYKLQRFLAWSGAIYDYQYVDGKPISGVRVAMTATTIRWTLAKSAAPGLTPRSTITNFEVRTASIPEWRDWAPDGRGRSTARYRPGTPSCLRPA